MVYEAEQTSEGPKAKTIYSHRMLDLRGGATGRIGSDNRSTRRRLYTGKHPCDSLLPLPAPLDAREPDACEKVAEQTDD